MRRPLRFVMPAALLAALVVPTIGSSVSAAEPWPMPKFLETKPRWDEFADARTPLAVEGRIGSYGTRLMRLEKCPLGFRPAGDDLPPPGRDSRRVVVRGKLSRDGGGLTFVVSSVTPLPSDEEEFRLQKAAGDAGDPAAWYRLAEWAIDRGAFYDDAFLLKEATAARRRGVELERRAAAAKPETLRKLADKAAGWKLDDLRGSLVHQALRREWAAAQDDPAADLSPLLRELARLPGADVPAIPWPTQTAAAYAADPAAVYDLADAKARATLHRLFYVAVKQTAVERQAAPDGSNGAAVAAALDAALPERGALAERYRSRALEYRLKHVAAATRDEAVALAAAFTERGEPVKAARATAAWLAAREASLRPDGVGGLVRAAEDHLAVAGDEAAALRLLREADALAPESKLVAEKLTALGYVRHGKEWLSAAEFAALPEDPVLTAMREGRVAVGMSPEQVRRTLGNPDRVARAAAVSQVHEVWLFGAPGRGGVAVHFLRYAARPADEARVVSVGTIGR